MRFLAAFRFLTVIPLPFKRDAGAADIGGSIVYFPVVGLAIGLLAAGAYWIFEQLFPAALANVLIIAGLVLVTGALHLDGFIDTCDGLAGNKPAEDRWQVMRDSRVGAFGVVGGVLLLLLKFVALNGIPHRLVFASLIMMPVISRWLMVYAITAYPYARPDGLGTVFKRGGELGAVHPGDGVHFRRGGRRAVVAGGTPFLPGRPRRSGGCLGGHPGLDAIPELEVRRPHRRQLWCGQRNGRGGRTGCGHYARLQPLVVDEVARGMKR